MNFLSKNIIKMKEKSVFNNKLVIYALSFALPFLLMLAIYAFFGIYPAGKKTVLTFDLNTQYSIFLEYFRRVLTGQESLFYSFSKGMGGNMYGLFTYYLSSPFSLLMIFFPPEVMANGIALIITLKIACSGLSFAIFLRHVFKKTDLSVVLFSCCYALSGYVMYYSMCIMWLDGIIWLPIILLGVERILNGKSGLLFVFSFVISMCSNYYTGYMTTIFVVIYFFSRYFATTEKTDKKDLINKTLKMLVWGVLGMLMSMVILLPTFLDILNGKMSLDKTDLEHTGGFISENIMHIPRHLFIGQFDDIVVRANPPIFCGMLSGLMLSVYLFNPKIKLRTKISAMAVFAVLFVSFFVSYIDIVWHIFQRPHGAFPFRYAYVFCFFTLMTAFHGFTELESIPLKRLFYAAALYAVILIDRFIFKNDVLTNKVLAFISLIIAGAYIAGIFAPLYLKKNLKSIILIGFVILTSCELVLNGYSIMRGIENFTGYKIKYQHSYYLKEVGDINDYIKEHAKGFHRWDKTFHHTKNDSVLFGYSSATSFSSAFNGNLIDKYRQFGILNDVFTAQYDGSTLITDSLLGMNYIVSSKPVNDEYKQIKAMRQQKIYYNPYALPLGFVTDKAVLKNQKYTDSYLENQGLFAEAVLGNSYVKENDILPKNIKAIRENKTLKNMVEFIAENDGLYYISFPEKFEGSFSMSVNNAAVKYPYDASKKRIFCLGNLATGDHVKLLFGYEQDEEDLEVYCLDAEKFKADCKSKIRNSSFEVTKTGNTFVCGNAKIGKDEVLLTTIPYENGWKAYADGKEVKVSAAQEAFLAVELPEGEYEIELKYSVPGLKISLIISLATFFGVIIYAIFLALKNRKNKSA